MSTQVRRNVASSVASGTAAASVAPVRSLACSGLLPAVCVPDVLQRGGPGRAARDLHRTRAGPSPATRATRPDQPISARHRRPPWRRGRSGRGPARTTSSGGAGPGHERDVQRCGPGHGQQLGGRGGGHEQRADQVGPRLATGGPGARPPRGAGEPGPGGNTAASSTSRGRARVRPGPQRAGDGSCGVIDMTGRLLTLGAQRHQRPIIGRARGDRERHGALPADRAASRPSGTPSTAARTGGRSTTRS